MKKFVMLPLAAIVMAGALAAAPIACPNTTTLAGLIALSGVNAGCITQDKIFNNFAYAGSTAAGDVSATLVFAPGPSTRDIHGWVFAPVGGPWAAGFTLSYSIAVAPPAAGGVAPAVIVATKDQVNSGMVPNSVVVNDLQTPNVGSPVTLTTRGMPGQETTQMPLSSASMVSTFTTATIPSGNLIQSYEQDWFESGVPEPASLYNLAGGACVLFGLLRFKKKVRA